MQAIILAGGKGTRLKPYTTIFPKPLLPIGDYPILEVVIKQLKHFGFDDITMAVGHLKELIQAFFNKGENWGVKISYSFEDKPLGTAAPLTLIERVDDDFLVMNGDVLTNLNYRDFFQHHLHSGAIGSIAIYAKPVHIDLGVLKVDEKQRVSNYIEKPTLHYDVSMGVYAFNKRVLEYIPKNEYFDFPELILKLIKNKQPVAAYPFAGRWMDIGRPEDYEQAIKEFETLKSEFLPDDHV
ncbi:NTP transferase domain-containing protein [candidate division KSB1 bacterium]|nr:NTP transferase domain-containing protein [candidate division KSB1 bacterium]